MILNYEKTVDGRILSIGEELPNKGIIKEFTRINGTVYVVLTNDNKISVKALNGKYPTCEELDEEKIIGNLFYDTIEGKSFVATNRFKIYSDAHIQLRYNTYDIISNKSRFLYDPTYRHNYPNIESLFDKRLFWSGWRDTHNVIIAKELNNNNHTFNSHDRIYFNDYNGIQWSASREFPLIPSHEYTSMDHWINLDAIKEMEESLL